MSSAWLLVVASAYRLALPPRFRVRPTVCRGFPQCVAHYPYPVPECPGKLEPNRVSQVPDASLHTSHALRWTPADPRDAHHCASSVLASGALTPSPSAFSFLTGLYQVLGSAVSPAGCVVPWVRFTCVVLSYIVTSSTAATLGMSGWLDLAQRGLAPRKKRQASLGALTPERTASGPTETFRIHSKPQPGSDAVAHEVRWRSPVQGFSSSLHSESPQRRSGFCDRGNPLHSRQ